MIFKKRNLRLGVVDDTYLCGYDKIESELLTQKKLKDYSDRQEGATTSRSDSMKSLLKNVFNVDEESISPTFYEQLLC